MKRTLIKDLKDHIGQDVLLKGWAQDVRNLSKIKFIILRDFTGDMQTIALEKKAEPESFQAINDITQESVIELVGTVKQNEQSRWGMEVVIKTVNILSKAQAPLPIDNSDKSQTNIDKRLDHRFLDTRNKKVRAIFTIKSNITKAVTDYFNEKKFTQIQTPKLTVIGVESGAELFSIKHFNQDAYLAQSPQIYKQMFMNGGFERVFEIGPVFRAEKSHTTRHLTEFTGVDCEMAFINDEQDLIMTAEYLFKHIIAHLNKHCTKELTLLEVELKEPKEFPQITMQQAKELLKEKGKTYGADDDLDAEGEKLLGEIIKEKHSSDFVFLTTFPWAARPFYHMKDEQGNTKSFDLLLNGVEVCTGAQREHRLEVLEQQATEKELNLGDMQEYREIFAYGIPPHGGIGFGLDRITQLFLGLTNVREAVLCPRDPERLKP